MAGFGDLVNENVDGVGGCEGSRSSADLTVADDWDGNYSVLFMGLLGEAVVGEKS